jgi:uncharacterized metal-binding protein
MPSGRTHDRINLISTAIAGYLAYRWGFSWDEILAFSLGSIVATFWFSPDLDLKTSKPVKRWGKLSFIWWPYAAIVPHRGISHIPIIGILTRFGYFFGIVFLIWLVVRNFLPISINVSAIFNNPYFLPFILGVLFADTLHILADFVYSSIKSRSFP